MCVPTLQTQKNKNKKREKRLTASFPDRSVQFEAERELEANGGEVGQSARPQKEADLHFCLLHSIDLSGGLPRTHEAEFWSRQVGQFELPTFPLVSEGRRSKTSGEIRDFAAENEVLPLRHDRPSIVS